ncbi:MAG: hypothetical protein ACKVS6_15080 [Planctomycetota bacterium]
MKTFSLSTLFLAGALAAPLSAQGNVGAPPPEFDAAKWYNFPPVTLAELNSPWQKCSAI